MLILLCLPLNKKPLFPKSNYSQVDCSAKSNELRDAWTGRRTYCKKCAGIAKETDVAVAVADRHMALKQIKQNLFRHCRLQSMTGDTVIPRPDVLYTHCYRCVL